MKYRCFCGETFINIILLEDHSKKCEMDIPMKLHNLSLYVHSLSSKCDKMKKDIIAMHQKISINNIE